MESKEHLRKSTKIKLIVMSLSVILPILLLVLFEFAFFKEKVVVYQDLVVLRYAIFVLLEGYIGVKIYNYVRILTDIDYADMTLIRKNDERLNYIRLRTNAMVIKIFIYMCGIALIITGFFNAYIFYTLLSILVVVLLIYLFVYIYFSKKY